MNTTPVFKETASYTGIVCESKLWPILITGTLFETGVIKWEKSLANEKLSEFAVTVLPMLPDNLSQLVSR